jgi:hypothetical protein
MEKSNLVLVPKEIPEREKVDTILSLRTLSKLSLSIIRQEDLSTEITIGSRGNPYPVTLIVPSGTSITINGDFVMRST